MSLDTRFKYICKTVLCYAELNHPADAGCVCAHYLSAVLITVSVRDMFTRNLSATLIAGLRSHAILS